MSGLSVAINFLCFCYFAVVVVLGIFGVYYMDPKLVAIIAAAFMAGLSYRNFWKSLAAHILRHAEKTDDVTLD